IEPATGIYIPAPLSFGITIWPPDMQTSPSEYGRSRNGPFHTRMRSRERDRSGVAARAAAGDAVAEGVGDDQREHEQRALDEVLGVVGHVEHREPVEEHAHEQRADHRAEGVGPVGAEYSEA